MFTSIVAILTAISRLLPFLEQLLDFAVKTHEEVKKRRNENLKSKVDSDIDAAINGVQNNTASQQANVSNPASGSSAVNATPAVQGSSSASTGVHKDTTQKD